MRDEERLEKENCQQGKKIRWKENELNLYVYLVEEASQIRPQGPSTISQLKETTKLNLSNITFISETKQKTNFVRTVCKSLKCRNRWDVVEHIGKKGRMLVFWGRQCASSYYDKVGFSY